MNFPDDPFTSGLPRRLDHRGRGRHELRHRPGGDRLGRCNCPLKQDEKQFQFVSNFTKSSGTTPRSSGSTSGARTTCAYRATTTARATSTSTRSARRDPPGGGMGLATFLLGDVTDYRRYVSSSTDAREEQWRWFLYAQDTWRAAPKWTFNYGLRVEDIMPQTINEAGNAGFLDIDTGEMMVVGVGGIGLDGNVKNKINLAPRLGITYQLNERTVIRTGYGRSYDIGVFGSTFGHSVTQNLPVLARQQTHCAPELRERLQPGPGTAGADVPRGGRERPLPGSRRGSAHPAARAAEAALRGRLEPDRPARADPQPLGRDRLRRQQGDARVRRGRARRQLQPGDPGRLPQRAPRPAPALLRGPGGRLRRGLRLEPRRALHLQLLRQQLQLAADQADQALRRRLLAARHLHPAAGEEPRRRPVLLRPRSRVRRARSGPARTSPRSPPPRAAVRQGQSRTPGRLAARTPPPTSGAAST